MTPHEERAHASAGTCPGCGLAGPELLDPPPAELVASAACYRLLEALLARSYGDPHARRLHQLIVDAYVAQHAGGRTRREVQKVALCLMTLCLFCERGADPASGPALHQRMVRRRPPFRWLEPPSGHGLLTVADALAAEGPAEQERLLRDWAEQVWCSWSAHHTTVREWNRHALG